MNKLLIVLVLLLVAVSRVSAATFNVTKTTDTADGTCDADCSLREAVIAANALADSDTINLPAGVYRLNLTGFNEDSATTGDLDLLNPVTILGDSPTTTIVDGNGTDRVFDVFAAVVANISALTIRNGDGLGTDGGGVRNEDGIVTVSNVTVSGNVAKNGGALANTGSNSTFNLENTTLSGNTGEKGGAINSSSGGNRVWATNVTISGNTATSEGGGLAIDHVSLTNSTITLNTAPPGKGSGISDRGSQPTTLLNTIVANNTNDECSGTIVDAGGNLDDDGTCGVALTANPLLGPLQDNGGPTQTHALLTGSPAIDAVLAGCPPPATDQRGVARPLGANCDIGAFETAAYSLAGTVFEDLVGDVLNDGVIGDALNPARSGVDVFLYEDSNSNDLPDVGEPLVSGPTNPVTTDGSGAYSFAGLIPDDYLVVVDSRDFDPTQAYVASPVHWAEQTYGPVGGQCADWVSSTVKRVTAGPCYGGRRGAIFDDLASGVENSEHVAAVTVVAANVADVDFGFSFNVVTNLDGTRDGVWSVYTGQGTIDMFLRNATAITVPNTMRFVPAVPTNMTGPVFGGKWWRIDVDGFSGLFLVDDTDTTIDGTAHDPADGTTVLDTNPGFMGANTAGGLTVGLDAIALPQVARPELELRGSISVWHDGHRAIIQDMAFTEGISLISVYTAGEVRIRRNVLGSEPDDFVQPAGISTSGVHVRDGGFDGFVEDNLIGFSYNGVQLGSTTKVATGWQITGNEIRDCYDGVEAWQLSPDNTVQGNLLAGNWRGVTDRAGSNSVTSNTISASGLHGVVLAGSSTPVTRNIIENGLDPVDGDPVNGVLVLGDETPGYANSPARLNRISDNRFGGNSWISIDLAASGTLTTGDGVTPNDGGTDASHGHNGLDHPVITSAELSGGTATIVGTTCSGCTVEIYRAVADGDGSDTYLGDDYGEGIALVATTTADAGGAFSVGGVGGLSPGDSVSAIAFTTAAGAADTSEFGPNFPVGPLISISGTVFEDVNYGGGIGRDLTTAQADAPSFTVRRGNVTVELYDAAGGFLSSTTTAVADGSYGFTGLTAAQFTVRVVNDTVTSSRPGSDGSELGLQTYRIDGDGEPVGTGAQKVGGERPAGEDAAANSGAQTLADLQGTDLDADGAREWTQSIVTVDTAGGDVTGADFGFNFDTIVNTGDAGQGSLRQFILNANTLTNGNLDQAGLTAGAEHSLFMIPAAALTGAVGSRVAEIAPLSPLPPISDAFTVVDATLQTVLIGDENTGSLGSGGAVGVDALALGQVQRPEVQIFGDRAALPGNTFGLTVAADDVTLRGLAVYGFATADLQVVGPLQRFLIEDCIVGAGARSFADPGPTDRSGTHNVAVDGSTDGTLQNNLIGFSDGADAVIVQNGNSGIDVLGNEIRQAGIGSATGAGLTLLATNSGCTIRGNLITLSGGIGINLIRESDTNTVENNSVSDSGRNGSETAGIRIGSGGVIGADSDDNVLRRNVVSGNPGSGVVVSAAGSGNRITENSIFDNGGISIDLTDTGGMFAPDPAKSDRDPDAGEREPESPTPVRSRGAT